VKTKYSNFQKFRIQTFMISNSSWTQKTHAQVIMKIFRILYLLLRDTVFKELPVVAISLPYSNNPRKEWRADL